MVATGWNGSLYLNPTRLSGQQRARGGTVGLILFRMFIIGRIDLLKISIYHSFIIFLIYFLCDI